MIIRSRWRRMR